MRILAKLCSSRQAMGLTELIIATAVGSVMTAAALGAFVGLQRAGTTYAVSGEARANQVRLLEALQRDLRAATSYTLGVNNALPVTIKMRQLYSDYETSRSRAGEPKQGAGTTRQIQAIDPDTGNLLAGPEITVRFVSAAVNGGIVVSREVTWPGAGGGTASRAIANFTAGTVVTVQENPGVINPTTGMPLTPSSATLTVKAAPATQRSGRAPVAVTMSETVFLRARTYR